MAKRSRLRIISFKTTEQQWDTLEQCASAYRAANVSHFLREMVGAVTSGSETELRDFNTRLMSGFGRIVGEQLTIQALSAAGRPPGIKPTPRKLPKVRRRRERTT